MKKEKEEQMDWMDLMAEMALKEIEVMMDNQVHLEKGEYLAEMENQVLMVEMAKMVLMEHLVKLELLVNPVHLAKEVHLV